MLFTVEMFDHQLNSRECIIRSSAQSPHHSFRFTVDHQLSLPIRPYQPFCIVSIKLKKRRRALDPLLDQADTLFHFA
jgi:hypothetical protein